MTSFIKCGKAVACAAMSCALLVLAGSTADATPANLISYRKAYPKRAPKIYSCRVCHEHPVGHKADLNAYGQALKRFKGPGKAKALTVQDYKDFDARTTQEK